MENQVKRVLTKGNLEVQNIKVGDIHYEYAYGFVIKSQVITEPKRDEEGYWSWQSKKIDTEGNLTNEIIDYGVDEEHSHYGPNLYDKEVYFGMKQI